MSSLSEFSQYAREVGERLSDQPLQVAYSRQLGATQQELFDYVSDTDRLSEWIPGARKTWSDDSNAEAPKQVGSVRMISTGVGKPTREVVKAYEAPRMIAYSATDDSLFGMFTDHLSVITCEAHPSGGSVFSWLAYGRPADSQVKRWIGDKVFRFALGQGTKALERRFPFR